MSPTSPPPPPALPPTPPCSDCGGPRVGPMYLADGQGMSTAVLRPPRRRLWWRRDRLASLVAYVCLRCGNAKLYADDLAVLRAAAGQHPGQLGPSPRPTRPA